DLVVFPDHGRADRFARAVGLATDPTVVMNCPRKLSSIPCDRLEQVLESSGCKGSRAVYFHGWIGPSRCMEVIIRSMRLWPKCSVLVLVGPISAAYHNALLQVANS